jgi:hypothetical protein
MTPSATAAHPAVLANASTPDGSDGDTSSSSVTVSPAGALVATGDARLHQASFGGGALVMHAVHTAVTITNAGTPKADISTTVGDAAVGGVPVSIGQGGVTVGPQVVPADQVQQATAQLNAVLTAAGITVGTLAPAVKTSSSQETVTATAATVTIDQPGPPQQTVRHNLGNVFVDNLAVPSAAAAAPALDAGDTSGAGLTAGSGSAGGLSSSVGDVSGGFGSSGASAPSTGLASAPGSAPSASPAAQASSDANLNAATLAGQHVKPTWLLVMYLIWQVLMLGTTATVWWWRSTPRPGTAR